MTLKAIFTDTKNGIQEFYGWTFTCGYKRGSTHWIVTYKRSHGEAIRMARRKGWKIGETGILCPSHR